MFTLVPVVEVSVIVLISTMKDRRFVLGSGVSGAAVNVRLTVALPPPQLTVQGGGVVRGPLHESREPAENKDSVVTTLPRLMSPQAGVCKPKRRGTNLPSTTLSCVCEDKEAKRQPIVQLLNAKG